MSIIHKDKVYTKWYLDDDNLVVCGEFFACTLSDPYPPGEVFVKIGETYDINYFYDWELFDSKEECIQKTIQG